MVNIDTFKIDFSQDLPVLIAEISVPSDSGYTNVYIKKVTIGTQDTFDKENNIFSTDYFDNTDNIKDDTQTNKVIYYNGMIYEDNTPSEKSLTLNFIIDENKTKLSDLFFIEVETDGTYGADVPCNATGNTWGSVYDQFSVESKGMQYIRELANTCETPEGMIDYILNKEAIDVAAGCGDYSTMIERYEELNSTTITTSTSKVSNYKKCGCNG